MKNTALLMLLFYQNKQQENVCIIALILILSVQLNSNPNYQNKQFNFLMSTYKNVISRLFFHHSQQRGMEPCF